MPSNLIAYEDAILLGRIEATVTESGITVTGRFRSSRDGDFGVRAARVLRLLAFEATEEQASGLAADVFDTALTQGMFGEAGHVRIFPVSETNVPALPARTLLGAVARRIAIRWPYKP